ncbi:MAG TPA: hypothetical protein VGY76_13440 [Solirubrobacteraceae bacterium]|nr:hypothetical protein [Solirubrobacteraceae bacterium]
MPVDVQVEHDGDQRRLGGVALQVVTVCRDIEPVGAPSAAPAAACGLALKAGEDALHDQCTLELGEHAEHLHHHPARWGAGVEWLGR